MTSTTTKIKNKENRSKSDRLQIQAIIELFQEKIRLLNKQNQLSQDWFENMNFINTTFSTQKMQEILYQPLTPESEKLFDVLIEI